MRHAPLRVLVAAALLFAGGCAETTIRSPFVVEGMSEEKKIGPAQLTPSAVQSEVMSYTDTFVAAVSQIWNAIAANARKASTAGGLTEQENARLNAMRRAALEIKLANVNAALLIASSPNPLVALSDMITVVSLQRMVIEAESTRRTFGEEIQSQLLVVYTEQETNAWAIAKLAMSEKQRDELRAMIKQWRDDHPDATYVSSVRLDDFASARQIAVAPKNEKNPSLLAALSLDPLAGLDPAQREVTQTRLLAERVFFYASRAPNVLKWQVESLYQALMQGPEVQGIMRSAHEAGGAAQDISAALARLPEQITAEREALFRQFFAELSREREATLAQVNDALSRQRTEALRDLESAQGRFQGTLRDFNQAATSATALADKLTQTIAAADTLAARFAPAGGAAPAKTEGAEGDPLREFSATADRTANAAERLTQLARSLDQLIGSPGLREGGPIRAAVREVQMSSKELVDYAFWRALMVVVIAPFAVVLAMLGYRRLTR